MTLTESLSNDRIRITLRLGDHFFRPTTEFTFKPVGNQTEVTWVTYGHNFAHDPLVDIGREYETALARLAVQSEQAWSETLEEASGNIGALRELISQNPGHQVCKYLLAAALIENRPDAEARLEARQILDSIPSDVKPEWSGNGLAEWLGRQKRRQIARLAIQTIQAQNLPPSEGSADVSLVNDLEAASHRLRTYTAEQVREDLMLLKQLVQDYWACIKEKEQLTGKSLHDLLESRLREIEPDMLPADAVQLLERFVADLRDGHCRSPRFFSDVLRPGLPFRLTDTADGLIVDKVHSDCDQIAQGDRVVKLNERPIEDWVALQETITAASDDRARRVLAIHSMSDALVRQPRSRPSEMISVTRERMGTEAVVECQLIGSSWADELIDNENWLTSRRISPTVGYIRIRSWVISASSQGKGVDVQRMAFGQRKYNELDKVFEELRDTSSLIVDVRQNPGGDGGLCHYCASHFVEGPFSELVAHHRNPRGDMHILADRFEGFKGRTFKGHVYVLCDHESGSASPRFVYLMKSHLADRVTLVGRECHSNSCSQQIVGTLPHSGLVVAVSILQTFDPQDKKPLEGNPIPVDVRVEWTRDDVLNDRDPDLEKALELIQKRT